MRSDFTPASIRGSYAMVVTGEGGRAPCAAIGLLAFDGAGRVAGSLIESRPGVHFAERAIAAGPYVARYTLAGDGIGTLIAESADDAEALVAIRAVEHTADASGATVASEIAVLFRELDPESGCLRTAAGRRLPDDARFGQGSLSGRYTGFAVGRGGQVTLGGFGVLVYDGAGGFSETNTSNVQGDTIRVRRFVAGTDRGRYAVNADGTGSVADGGVLFVITKATRRGDGTALAEEYSFMLRDLVPGNGAYFTGIVRRISD